MHALHVRVPGGFEKIRLIRRACYIQYRGRTVRQQARPCQSACVEKLHRRRCLVGFFAARNAYAALITDDFQVICDREAFNVRQID